MKCEEVQSCQGSYLDSELDARTTLEIQEHLKGCEECARLFAEEQRVEAWMKSGLERGEKSPAVWARIESGVLARSKMQAVRPSWVAFTALRSRMKAGPLGVRLTWAGLAAAWMAILVLNIGAREHEPTTTARQEATSPSEIRYALSQKRTILVELVAPSERATGPKQSSHPPSPRTERNLNSFNS